MVSRAHTDDATPRAHPAHVARSLSPCVATDTRSNRIGRVPRETNGYARGRMIGA